MTDKNLYLAEKGEGRQSPRDAALDSAVERLNREGEGHFSTDYGPIQAYYFFWDRVGDIDYLNLEIVFSKNPKVCYQSLKRTIGTRDKDFYYKDLLRLSLECVSDIFKTVEIEGKIERTPPSYIQKEEAIYYVDSSRHDEVVPMADNTHNLEQYYDPITDTYKMRRITDGKPPVFPAKHTEMTEPTPRYEDLKAQLEYAEEIIRRLLCCVVDFSGFENELTREIAARYLLGDKTPAEFFRKRAEFLKATNEGEKS
jgi:hypothetical protein